MPGKAQNNRADVSRGSAAREGCILLGSLEISFGTLRGRTTLGLPAAAGAAKPGGGFEISAVAGSAWYASLGLTLPTPGPVKSLLLLVSCPSKEFLPIFPASCGVRGGLYCLPSTESARILYLHSSLQVFASWVFSLFYQSPLRMMPLPMHLLFLGAEKLFLLTAYFLKPSSCFHPIGEVSGEFHTVHCATEWSCYAQLI